MSAPKMRTLPEAAAELKRMDEHTAITLTALRRMVKAGELPYLAVGNKRLINFDLLLDRLKSPAPHTDTDEIGRIRRIV